MLVFLSGVRYLRLTVAIFFILMSLNLNFAQNDPCRTSKDEIGDCILIDNCTFLKEKWDSYGSYRNVPGEFTRYIRHSRCRQKSKGFHVCCAVQRAENRFGISSGRKILESMDCGTYNGDRIAFGTEASLKQFPWMALLKYDDQFHPFKCGGSLITNNYILTAAHCIDTSGVSLIGVRLGEHDLSTEYDCRKIGKHMVCNDPVEDFGIARKVAHPHYARNNVINDIGLIKLDRDVVFRDHIKPICLPLYESTNEVLDTTNPYLISGWGITENGTSSEKLLFATVYLKDNFECERVFKITCGKEYLCGKGRDGEDTCRGDSGGPLISKGTFKNQFKFIQYGVISGGVYSCGNSKQAWPAIYTNVREQLEWIAENIVI